MTRYLTRSAALALGVAALTPRWGLTQTASTVRTGASAAATQAEAYYAEQLGMFKQAGITTTQTIVTRSSDTVAAIVRGDIDVGSTTPQAIANAIIHGIPIKIIACGPIYAGDPPSVQFVVSKKGAIRNDAAAYENAMIGVQTLNDSQTVGIKGWFQKYHINPNKAKFIELTFPTMPAALDRGEIQAGCMVEPFITANRDLIREVPHVYDVLGHHWSTSAWYARTEWIEKNPSLVKAFVGALYATAKRINPNPSMIDDLLVAYSKVPIASVRATPKPIFAEALERSQIEPQMILSAQFGAISRPVSYAEMVAR